MAALARQDSTLPTIQQIARLYPSPTYIEALFRKCWQVVPDPPEFEFVRAPKHQAEFYLENGYLEGDCDDASVLSSCLLTSLGWENVIMAIRRQGEVEFSHVFTRARENGLLIDIDPIVPVERMPIRDIAETMYAWP